MLNSFRSATSTTSTLGARPVLYCLPHAGGDAFGYQPWVAQLAADADVRPVQLPGRGRLMDQACCTRMPEVVAWLLRQTRPPQDSPIVLFGHSMGSLIAYELARAWRAEGVDLRLLVVSGHGAPDLSRPRPALHRLSDAALLVELARQGGTPDEVMTNPEMMALFLPILRADFGICETYRPTAAPPLDVNILAVGGADDADYAPPSLRAWHRYTDRRFQHVTLPGGHFFINTHRDELFGALRRALTETLGSRR